MIDRSIIQTCRHLVSLAQFPALKDCGISAVETGRIFLFPYALLCPKAVGPDVHLLCTVVKGYLFCYQFNLSVTPSVQTLINNTLKACHFVWHARSQFEEAFVFLYPRYCHYNEVREPTELKKLSFYSSQLSGGQVCPRSSLLLTGLSEIFPTSEDCD